jgi:trimeric autotransporter adhesin
MSLISTSSKAAVVVLAPLLIVLVGCGTETPTSPSRMPTSSPALTDGAVTATDTAGYSTASSPNARTAATLAPPTQEAPANGATDQPTTITVRWTPANVANPVYDVQIARDSAFSSLVANARITDGSIGYTVFNLANGTRYFWRVRLSTGGNTSAWSSIWSFQTTSRDRPAPPTLLSPGNGATGVPRSPTLTWSAVAGAESYQVEISPFGTHYYSVQGTSFTISEEALSIGYTDRHTWRVRARNAAGVSDWSELWVFTRSSR